MATIKTQEELDEERRRRQEAEAAKQQQTQEPEAQPQPALQQPQQNLPFSQQYQQTSQANVDAMRAATEKMAGAIDEQGKANVAEMEASQQQYNEAQNEAQRQYRARMDAGYKSIYDIISNEDNRIRQEQQQAADLVKADVNAAKWTGLTELASSIANMIGVGSYNAVSQQYKPFSQDWMRKADQDMREHRYRIDNLKARQNQLRMQLDQMKMGDAQQALALARENANNIYNQRITLQGARNDAALKGLEYRNAGEERARAAELAGIQGAAGLSAQEDSQRQGWARLQQQKDQFAAQMAANGLNADGTPNEDLMQQHAAAASKVTANNTSKGGDSYNVTINGQKYAINMTKESRQQAMKDCKPEMRDDLVKLTGAKNWEELTADLAEKKSKNKKYEKYENLIAALENTNPEDQEAVAATMEAYFEKYRNEFENVGMHLYRVSSGARSFGMPQLPKQDVNAPGGSRFDALMSGSWNSPKPRMANHVEKI